MGLAATVAGLAAHRQRAVQIPAGVVDATRFQRAAAQGQFGFALDLAILDPLRNAQAVTQAGLRERLVAGIDRDLAQVQQPDRFAEPLAA